MSNGKKIIALCSHEANRDAINRALAAEGYKVSFFSQLTDIGPAIHSVKPIMFIHDWGALEDSQSKKFQLNFSRNSEYKHILRVILVNEIAPSMMAFCSDAQIEKVISYGNIGNLNMEISNLQDRHSNSELYVLFREFIAITFSNFHI